MEFEANLSRRTLLGAIGVGLCAPAIVRVTSIMPVKAYRETTLVVEKLLEIFMFAGDNSVTAGTVKEIDRASFRPGMVPFSEEQGDGRMIVAETVHNLSFEKALDRAHQITNEFGIFIHPPSSPGGVVRYVAVEPPIRLCTRGAHDR